MANIYVIIWCLYNPFIELSKGGSNTQHSMLAFHKKNTAPQKKIASNIANIYVSTFAIF